MMTGLANHLWQSTVFVMLIALVCATVLRRTHARTRYWLWLAASVKFLIPFSLLVSLGMLVVEAPVESSPVPAMAVERLSASFAPVPMLHTPVMPRTSAIRLPRLLDSLAVIWATGAVFCLLRWFASWRRLNRVKNGASALALTLPIPALLSDEQVEPGVFGLLRPVLLLPDGIADRLSTEQFDAIVAHEVCHVRYRDNLTAAVHMIVETAFWFHPLVWWIGSKLVEERERACDESVLDSGSRPEAYAEGILNVCRFYVESPLRCASGVTGADLKKRVLQILTGRASGLTFGRKLLLAVAGLAALVVPIELGILRAQTLPPAPQYTYEVASVRPSKPGEPNSRIMPGPQGGMRTQNTSLTQLITFAYRLGDYQIVGVPDWTQSARFDVEFTPDKAEALPSPGSTKEVFDGFSRNQQRMQAVLRDRFGLVLRAETRQLPMYALTIAKGGHKLVKSEEGVRGPMMRFGRGSLDASGAYLSMLAYQLGQILGRYVVDETGLEGTKFNMKMNWTPERPAGAGNPSEGPAADEGPSLFTALTQQLGLKLESKKGPVPVFVIEKVEKPAAN